jgi:hypothetical protein
MKWRRQKKGHKNGSRETLVLLRNVVRRLNQAIGNWEWNIETGDLTWTAEIFKMFGKTPETFKRTYADFLETVHPDDREFVKQKIDDAVYRSQLYSIDHRIVLPDQSVRLVHEEGKVYFDASGKPKRMKGTVRNITEYGPNSESDFRDYILQLLESLTERERENALAIRGLQVRCGALSLIGGAIPFAIFYFTR